MRASLFIVAGSILLFGGTGCVKNPVTGRNELSLLDERDEIQLGRDAAKDFEETIGLYGDPKVSTYVSQLGERLAKKSQRPHLPWTFNVLDDAAVNAFALPGGRVYVTRGLLAMLNSEAELAVVLGHEIGHVTARHGANQYTSAAIAGVGAGVLGVFSRGVGAAASAGSQLLLLSHSREAEDESDRLGFQYAIDEGYDARVMADVMKTFAALEKEAGQNQLPEWLSTHPNPAGRQQAAEQRIAAQFARSWESLARRRDEYLHVITGLPYGDDPRRGYFDDAGYQHPGLAVRLLFPVKEWNVSSDRWRVAWTRREHGVLMMMSTFQKGSESQALAQFFRDMRARPIGAELKGLTSLPSTASAYALDHRGAVYQGYVAYVTSGDYTFELLTFAPSGVAASYDEVFRDWMYAFGRITDPKKLAEKAARIEVVPAPRDMTIEEFQKEQSPEVDATKLRLLNGLEPGAKLTRGQLVKRVVGKPF